MFDFDGAKLIIIGIVMLIVIKPKDLPGVMRQVGQAMAQVTRMANEFRGQVDEAMREAELHDLKKDVEKMTNLDTHGLNPFTSVRDDLAATKAEIDSALNAPASPPTPFIPSEVDGPLGEAHTPAAHPSEPAPPAPAEPNPAPDAHARTHTS